MKLGIFCLPITIYMNVRSILPAHLSRFFLTLWGSWFSIVISMRYMFGTLVAKSPPSSAEK